MKELPFLAHQASPALLAPKWIHPAMWKFYCSACVTGQWPSRDLWVYPQWQVSHRACRPSPQITARRLVCHHSLACFRLPPNSLKLADEQAGFSPASLIEKDWAVNSSATHHILERPPGTMCAYLGIWLKSHGEAVTKGPVWCISWFHSQVLPEIQTSLCCLWITSVTPYHCLIKGHNLKVVTRYQ